MPPDLWSQGHKNGMLFIHIVVKYMEMPWYDAMK
jgi:hypothetical protein